MMNIRNSNKLAPTSPTCVLQNPIYHSTIPSRIMVWKESILPTWVVGTTPPNFYLADEFYSYWCRSLPTFSSHLNNKSHRRSGNATAMDFSSQEKLRRRTPLRIPQTFTENDFTILFKVERGVFSVVYRAGMAARPNLVCSEVFKSSKAQVA